MSEAQNILDDFIKNKLANHISPVSAALWDKVNANIGADAALDSFVKSTVNNHSSAISNTVWDKINTNIGTDAALDHFIKTSIEDYASPVGNDLGDRIIGDEIIRDKLNKYVSQVPEGLWGKIFPYKDRKPTFIWWLNDKRTWLSAAAILLLIVGYTFFATVRKNPVESKSSASNSNESSLKENKVNVPKENNILKAEQTNSDHTIQQNNLVDQSSQLLTQNNSSAYSNHIASAVPYIKTQIPPFVSNDERIVSNTRSDNTQIISEHNYYTSSNNFIAGQLIPFNLNINDHANPFPPINLRNILGIGMSDCPSVNGNRQNDWYIEIYGSPDYTTKSIMQNNASNAYLQKIDSSQTMYGGFTAGVRIAKNIGEDFMFKAGLQYSQANELFNRKTVNEIRTTTVITARTIVRPQGDTTISDTSSVTQIGYSIKKAINQYKNIEIPVTLGYEFIKKDSKWKVGLNTGVIVNITSWASGETLDTAYNVVPISSNKGSSGVVYKTKAGVSLYASASIIREVNKKVEVFAEPYFRYGLSNTTTDVGYSQHFNAAGLTFGVRLKLNNKRQHL